MLLRQAHNIYLFIAIIVLMCYRPSNPPNESKQYSLENNRIVPIQSDLFSVKPNNNSLNYLRFPPVPHDDIMTRLLDDIMT